ncbi:MAG: hypothetical protein MRZ37_05790 [Tenericutes bacterium]|nr:hypothetical protein [Mycoplasmatota bacterium]
MKKILVIIFTCMLLCGCENKEAYKEQYINYKKQLFSSNMFTNDENLPLKININLKKEKSFINYNIIISDATEDLNEMQVLVVHNQITNEVYPSLGIFNEKGNLKPNDNSKLELNGSFETNKDIEEVVVSFKFVIKYTDSEGIKKIIYYKTTK